MSQPTSPITRGANDESLASESQLPTTIEPFVTPSSGNTDNPSRTITTPAHFNQTQAAELKALGDFLEVVNGQDAYSMSAISLGRLKREEFLVLPRGLSLNTTPAGLVGSSWDNSQPALTSNDFIQVYALNKIVGMNTKDPILFALARAEAVKMGWLDDLKEVRYEYPLSNAAEIFHNDKAAIEDKLESARGAAFLTPFVTEYIFRTTGHHYISAMADEYERKYQAIFSACLSPASTTLLRAEELYHKAFHWVGPRRIREVLLANVESEKIPHAIRIRMNAAPAGTAIVTTTSAVIDSMKGSGFADEVEKLGGYNFDKILTGCELVTNNVTNFHNAYFAYGVAAPTTDQKAAFDSAASEAIRFAPVAQGFINAFFSDSSLGRARALQKHADQAPVLQRRAMRVFRNLARADTENLSDIYRTTA